MGSSVIIAKVRRPLGSKNSFARIANKVAHLRRAKRLTSLIELPNYAAIFIFTFGLGDLIRKCQPRIIRPNGLYANHHNHLNPIDHSSDQGLLRDPSQSAAAEG